jgi:hypothetical protein
MTNSYSKLLSTNFFVDISGSLVSSSIVYQAGDTALLPCDISVPPGSSANGGDGLTLVMWYREDVGSPIYSIGNLSFIKYPKLCKHQKICFASFRKMPHVKI